MFDAAVAFAVDNDLVLEMVPTSEPLEHNYSTPGGYQRAWLNQICLTTFLDWLQGEITPNGRVHPNRATLPSFWEVVNGTAISFDNSRLVLLPTLAMDVDELRVPQEWVDIPEWVADYYLAVQVNPDEGWMRILGYTTHQQVKTLGVYDPGDRTYSLESDHLIPDLNVLWVTRQLYPQEIRRANVAPLTPLPQTQAANLLERLSHADIKFPRLEVPFPLWAALIAHGGWRQSLYELRQGISQPASIGRWLQDGVSNFSQQLGWEIQQFTALPSGMRSRENQTAILGLSRQILIADNTYELRVFPKGNPEEQIWRFELRNANPENMIPVGLQLKLLTEDLQPFPNNEDTATTPVEQLYVEVMLEPGEGLVWEVTPLPTEYEREILRF
ncbi:DUF1822 family protein [Nodularia sphaerocarpa]|uniref:DUF1822 family protein n=1 Tax=Nodularia sphaerocarpa TaxID=137816 RepID=UPI001EFA8C7D|nr:DUF1822 family protein [Nodularia sphaerocarpa]MDB9373353.1 DUF1822 family protein [Nodularia sphaerocarpa CS-585]MDB9378809.1 DUF1822 family protein [Nodularia sphaerocarpa CS-585A2]ULP71942.1 hypothetical protein BDGGKGIB_01579 [Nodularia sphaerocarpa UHCC 0038]